MGLLEIDFKFPDWGAKLKGAEAELNLFTAAQIQTNRGLLFNAEGGRNGHAKWAPLSLRSGQILARRGTLKKSIAPTNSKGKPGPDGIVRFSGDMIVVGTRLMYAKMMNYGTTRLPGGVLTAKNAKALKIPLPAGESATKKARTLRKAPIDAKRIKVIDRLPELAKKARSAKKTFERTGEDKHLTAAVNAEYRLRKARRQVDDLEASSARVMATGKGGQGFIFRKSVKIPARDFISWTAQDQAELDAAFLAKVAEVLNR